MRERAFTSRSNMGGTSTVLGLSGGVVASSLEKSSPIPASDVLCCCAVLLLRLWLMDWLLVLLLAEAGTGPCVLGERWCC